MKDKKIYLIYKEGFGFLVNFYPSGSIWHPNIKASAEYDKDEAKLISKKIIGGATVIEIDEE